MSFDWFGRLFSFIPSVARQNAARAKKAQFALRRDMGELLFTATWLSVHHGGFDPKPSAIRVGDIQRHDYVGRMREIADNEHFWEVIPERNTVRKGSPLAPYTILVERDSYRAWLRSMLDEHDQLEKRRV